MENQIPANQTALKRTAVIKPLLICGIVAALLYIITDTLLALSWTSYSYTSQTISELSAIGAPTRTTWIAMSFLFNPLVAAFGIGVWILSKEKRALRIAGILLTIWGILGFAWLFFPMHLRGALGSATDTMHIVMTAITVPLMVAFIAFGSGVNGKWFRLYSVLTILAMLVFGALTGMQAPKMVAQLPTPWMGVMERISVYSPMLWTAILSITLLHTKESET